MSPQVSHLISPHLLTALQTRGNVHDYAKNEIIVREGEVSDSLYILALGQLKVFSRVEGGREVVYNILKPGEVFGEMFLDGGLRSASVKAMTASQCIRVDAPHSREFIHDYPEFADRLIRGLITRLRHSTEMVKRLTFNYERTILLLNQVAETDGQVRYLPHKLTQQEIADRVGATREMINHVFSELTKGGFLGRDEKRRMIVLKTLPTHW